MHDDIKHIKRLNAQKAPPLMQIYLAMSFAVSCHIEGAKIEDKTADVTCRVHKKTAKHEKITNLFGLGFEYKNSAKEKNDIVRKIAGNNL